MTLSEAVEQIRSLPDAYIDSSFRQGREAIRIQLSLRSGKDEEDSVDNYIEDIQNTITELINKAKPYTIPIDYIDFLSIYGGLLISTDFYNFSVLGVGPMVEDWYGSVDGDGAFSEIGTYGFLSLGSLNFGYEHVHFFLEIGNTIENNSVIGIGPWNRETPTPSTIIRNLLAYPDLWKKISSSFNEWLTCAAETRGAFGYV